MMKFHGKKCGQICGYSQSISITKSGGSVLGAVIK